MLMPTPAMREIVRMLKPSPNMERIWMRLVFGNVFIIGYSVREFAQALHFLPHRLKQYYDLDNRDESQVKPHLKVTK